MAQPKSLPFSKRASAVNREHPLLTHCFVINGVTYYRYAAMGGGQDLSKGPASGRYAQLDHLEIVPDRKGGYKIQPRKGAQIFAIKAATQKSGNIHDDMAERYCSRLMLKLLRDDGERQNDVAAESATDYRYLQSSEVSLNSLDEQKPDYSVYLRCKFHENFQPLHEYNGFKSINNQVRKSVMESLEVAARDEVQQKIEAGELTEMNAAQEIVITHSRLKQDLAKVVVGNMLIGNHDCHAENIGTFKKSDGRVGIAAIDYGWGMGNIAKASRFIINPYETRPFYHMQRAGHTGFGVAACHYSIYQELFQTKEMVKAIDEVEKNAKNGFDELIDDYFNNTLESYISSRRGNKDAQSTRWFVLHEIGRHVGYNRSGKIFSTNSFTSMLLKAKKLESGPVKEKLLNDAEARLKERLKFAMRQRLLSMQIFKQTISVKIVHEEKRENDVVFALEKLHALVDRFNSNMEAGFSCIQSDESLSPNINGNIYDKTFKKRALKKLIPNTELHQLVVKLEKKYSNRLSKVGAQAHKEEQIVGKAKLALQIPPKVPAKRQQEAGHAAKFSAVPPLAQARRKTFNIPPKNDEASRASLISRATHLDGYLMSKLKGIGPGKERTIKIEYNERAYVMELEYGDKADNSYNQLTLSNDGGSMKHFDHDVMTKMIEQYVSEHPEKISDLRPDPPNGPHAEAIQGIIKTVVQTYQEEHKQENDSSISPPK